MAFSINTNVASLQAQYYLNKTQQFQNKTINEVTSGLRIVNAGDDAAGLAVANSYRSDQAVLTQGVSNLNSANATLQTIDAGMSNIGNLLDRARTLATQSASQTFTGDRTALNNEFQSVLTEINRQAQAIGMNSGGTFNSSTMQVFVGGGRTSGSVTASTNGSVTVDLTKSAVDTNSLGLASNGAAGNVDLRPGGSTNAISTAKGTSNPTTFTFYGNGFTAGQTVVVSATAMDAVNSTDDLVTAINTAIATSNGTNASFAASNIKASVDGSTGFLTFSGSTSFNVAASSSSDEGTALFGTTIVDSSGASAIKVATAFAAMTATDTQTLSFSARNAAGVMQSPINVNLTAGYASAAAAVTYINSQLNGANGMYAVSDDSTHITFMSATNEEFQVTVGAARIAASGVANAVGVNGGALLTQGSATISGNSATDISSQSGAVSAVTALATAVANLGLAQGTVGKHENQLNYATSLASTQLTNLASSESQIRDADLAVQAANLSKAQILSQAGVAALAQANSAPQGVLSLLKG